MAFFLQVLVASIAVSTQAFRIAQQGCSPVMAVHICKGGGAKWSTADRVSGLNAEDKKCMSLLCDEKGKEKCCEARDALLLAGVPAEEFKYAENAVIRMPTPPEETPQAIIDDYNLPEKTTCSKELRVYTFDTFERKFSLPETKMGESAEVVCGYGAKDPEAKVTFACGEDLKWLKTSGTCEKDLIVKCPAHEGAHAAKVQVGFGNDGLSSASYYFDLPEQPNAYGQDIVVSIKCPANARNKHGAAKYICHPSGDWEFQNETCSKDAVGVCYAREVTLAINDHEMAYKIPEKGPDVPYNDGEEVMDVPCKFGKYNQGSASLTCKGGAWVFNHELCHMNGVTDKEEREADAKFCNKMEMTFNLNHAPHVYNLEKGEIGDQASKPCSHGKLTEGMVNFECKESEKGTKWTLASNTCHAPPGTGCRRQQAPLQMTIKGGEKVRWVFNLQETEGPGMHEIPCPDGYTGNAKFECTEENKWSYQKGSAKCDKVEA